MGLEIAIPDSGPLISLGRIDRLDLLDSFNCPILVTDMVASEVLAGLPGAPDAAIFEAWFNARGNRVQTVETTMGMVWKALTEDQRGALKRIKDAGETSIWQFSNTLRDTILPGDYGVVLFEEKAVKGMDFGPHLAKVTTWSFLVGLEARGVIVSAEDLHARMGQAGRIIQKDTFEAPARSAAIDADWTDRLGMD